MQIPSNAKRHPVGIKNSIRSVGCPGTAWSMVTVQQSKRRKNAIQKAHVPSVKPKEATPQRHLDVIAIPNVEVLQQSFQPYEGEKEEEGKSAAQPPKRRGCLGNCIKKSFFGNELATSQIAQAISSEHEGTTSKDLVSNMDDCNVRYEFLKDLPTATTSKHLTIKMGDCNVRY